MAAITGLSWALSGLVSGAHAQRFPGYTVRVKLLADGHSEALYAAVIPAWEARTGGKVKVLSLKPLAVLDREIRADMEQRTTDYCLSSNHTSFNAQYDGLFRDLRPLVPASVLAHFDPHVLQLSQTRGLLLQVPRYSDISQVFYRKALYQDPQILAAYQARYRQPLMLPTTWTEYARQAQFFAGQTRQVGTQFAGQGEPLTGRFYEMLVAEGGELLDKNWRPAFDSPAGLRALNFFVDLYAAGAVSKETPHQGWNELGVAFASGTVALDLDWGGWAGYFNDPKTSKIAGQVGVMRAPKGSSGKRTGWSGLHTFSITRTCDNPAAAASLLMALTSLEAQVVEARGGALVARTDALTQVKAEFERAGNHFMSEVLQTFAAGMAENAFTPPLIPEWLAVSDALWPSLQKAILGEMGAAEALREADRLVSVVLRDAGRLR